MPTPDLERIAFVTRAYPRMRESISGLLLGPGLLLMVWGIELEESHYLRLGISLTLGAMVARWFLDRWLNQRFGRVLKTSLSEADRALIAVTVVFGAVGVLSLDDWVLDKGGPPVLMLTLVVVGLWLCVRAWPFRVYTLILPAVCAAAAVQLAVSGPNPSPDLRVLVKAAAILAWMTIGLLDLVALRRMFQHRSIEREALHGNTL
ncbi:MAG TPA: hypothetical protein VGD94_22545 [Vicinamibacterales bacterium]